VRKLFLIGTVVMTLLPAAAFARGPAMVVVGPAFAPYGWYGWYGPYYGPYPYGPYPGATAGEIKLDTDVKDAEVLINGSYAGTVRQLTKMMMRPGSYDISVRAPGRETFEQKVYVVAGKTLKLHPDLRVQSTPAPNTH
jgi:PEGA domain